MSPDETRQLNCGGYVILYAMVVDNVGLGRSVFHDLRPNESGASYGRATFSMKEILPATDNVKTIVLDSSPMQLNAFRAAYP